MDLGLEQDGHIFVDQRAEANQSSLEGASHRADNYETDFFCNREVVLQGFVQLLALSKAEFGEDRVRIAVVLFTNVRLCDMVVRLGDL